VNLIPNSAESGLSNFTRSFNRCRIFKRPMESLRGAGKDRARFLGVVADRNHDIERLADELIHRFGPLVGNVNPDLVHHGDGFRAHAARFRASGEYLEAISTFVAKQPFGHLASGRVSGAYDQDFLFCHIYTAVSIENQCRVRLHAAQTDSITGTSTSTPTTVASAAPDSGPKSAIAVATASSKKLLAPINAPGAATECSTFKSFIRPYASDELK